MPSKVFIFNTSCKSQVKWSSEHSLKVCNLWYISYPCQANSLCLQQNPDISSKSSSCRPYFSLKIKEIKWQFKGWIVCLHIQWCAKYPKIRLESLTAVTALSLSTVTIWSSCRHQWSFCGEIQGSILVKKMLKLTSVQAFRSSLLPHV